MLRTRLAQCRGWQISFLPLPSLHQHLMLLTHTGIQCLLWHNLRASTNTVFPSGDTSSDARVPSLRFGNHHPRISFLEETLEIFEFANLRWKETEAYRGEKKWLSFCYIASDLQGSPGLQILGSGWKVTKSLSFPVYKMFVRKPVLPTSHGISDRKILLVKKCFGNLRNVYLNILIYIHVA